MKGPDDINHQESSPADVQSPRPSPAKTNRRKLLVGSTTVLFLAAIVLGTIAYQDHADKKRQRIEDRSVVNVLNRQVESALRRRMEAPLMHADLKTTEVIARFLDSSVDLSQRRQYAYRLAREGSPEAIAALLKVLKDAPPGHKAFLAQLIGSSGNQAVKKVLLPLLDDENEQVVAGAIRGLGTIGGKDITEQLAGILADDDRSDHLRAVAALALGDIGTPEARTALVVTFGQDASDEVAAQILNSLGRFDFATVKDTFAEYLTAPETPVEMRVIAAEALAHSNAKAVPFLIDLAKSDVDAEVRASAAWAISAHDSVRDFGPALAELAEKELEVDVRRRLYEAMLPQSAIPAERLLPLVQAEKDISARVAGFNALGRAAAQQPTSRIATTFDQEMVPELMKIATSPNSLNIQMRAVFALRRAQTTAAKAALTEIAKSAQPQVAKAAQNGLRATNS